MAIQTGAVLASASSSHARVRERARAWCEQLQRATDVLLYESSGHDDATVYHALHELHDLFAEATTVRGDVLKPHHDFETFLDGGVAISPHLAARCLFDPLRTVQFLRGVDAAIHEALRRFPGERIHLLYAGCGLYACELSFPLRLYEYTSVESGARIRFSYAFGSKPRLRHGRVQPGEK
jgi:hypothetical protein